jgi:hypothetical protein
MIAFNLRLGVRSMRWLGPALILLIWTLLAMSDPGPALANAANLFIMLVGVTCWITVVIGNVDDDGHRELLAAAAGSPADLHRSRAITAYLAANAIGAVPTLAGLLATSRPTRSISEAYIVIACVLMQLAATAIGVAIGTMLHRPVIRHPGITLLASGAALVGLVLLPPVQYVLRQMNDGRTGGVVALTAAAVAVAAAAVATAGTLADRRN